MGDAFEVVGEGASVEDGVEAVGGHGAVEDGVVDQVEHLHCTGNGKLRCGAPMPTIFFGAA